MTVCHPLIISGERVETGRWDAVIDPGTQDVIARMSSAGASEADLAVRAAHAAFHDWSHLAPTQRAAHLTRYARTLDEHAAEIARTVHREVGKPRSEAEAEVARAIEVMHYFAGEAERVWAQHVPGGSVTTGSQIRPVPLGVVAAITPWNFPAALVLWKLGPALAAGCTLVVKPAQEAPLTAWMLCHLAERSGIPAGVVNCITGDGPVLGEALATHPLVAKMAFTGSRRVAEQIAAWASPLLKSLSLELGGHGALLVLPDADVDIAVDVAIVQGYANAGQACYSVNRVLVTSAVAEPFLERFRARMADVVMGPMATQRGLARHRALLEDARARGASVEGGEDIGPGRVNPALVTNARPGVRVVDEEPFTPIVVVMEVDGVQAAIAEANRPDYGLVNYVCGRDLRVTLETASALTSGTVVINGWRVVVPFAPYGGWRGSGLGTELGRAGMEAFLHWQHVRVLA